MEKITCDACGSTHLLKNGENYVCQNCGTKYYLQTAKNKEQVKKSFSKKHNTKTSVKYFFTLLATVFCLLISLILTLLHGLSLIIKVASGEVNLLVVLNAVIVVFSSVCGYCGIRFLKKYYAKIKR